MLHVCPFVFLGNNSDIGRDGDRLFISGICGVPFLNSQAHAGLFGKRGFYNSSSLLWVGDIHKPGEIPKVQESSGSCGAFGLQSETVGCP